MSSERPTNYPPQTPERESSSDEDARRTIDPSNLLLPTIRSGEESNDNNIGIRIPSLNHRYDVRAAAPMDYNVAQAWLSSGNQQNSSSNGSTSKEESAAGLEAFQDELADSIQGDSSKDKSNSSSGKRRMNNPLRGLRKNLFSSSAAQQAQQEDSNQVQSDWHQHQPRHVDSGQLHIVEQYNQFDSWLAQNEANGSMPSTPPVSLPSTPPSLPDDLMNLSSSNSSKANNNNNNNNNHVKHSYGQTPVPEKGSGNQDEKKDDVQDGNGSFKAVANPGDIEESPFEWMRNPSVPDEIVLDDDQQGNMEDELLTGDGGENSINLHNKNINQQLFRPPTLGSALSRPAAIRGEDRQITPQSWHTPISMLPRAMTKRTTSGGSRRSVPLSPGSRRSAKSEKYFHSYQTNLGAPPKPVPPFVVVHNSGSAVVTVTPKRTTVVPASKPKLGKSRKIRKAAAATAAAADLEPIIAEESIRSGKEANCGCDGEEAKVWCRMWGRPVSIALASAVLALAIVTVVTSLVASRFQRKPQEEPQLRPRVPEAIQSPTVAPSKGFPDFGNLTNSTDLDSSWEGAILRPFEGNETVARPTAPPRTLPPAVTIPTFAPSMLPDNFPEFVPTSAPFLQEAEDDLDEENIAFQIPWNNYVIGLLSVESPSTFAYFDDPTSPQFLALQWISVDSSRKGGSIAFTMDASLQRFALATVYFSLGGIDDWFESDNWLSTVVPVCEWKGVTCDSSNSTVLSIDLHSNNLSGTLPDELKLLKYLQVLNFHENAISGSLPPAYARLYEMKELDLSGNALTGSIPEEYGGAGAFEWLKVLDVSHNGIQGSLPSQLGNLKQVETIRMCDNAITGTVPSALGSLGQLRSVKLGNNELTGDLPGAICDTTSDIVFDCTVECECCTSCCAYGEDCC